MGILNLTTYKEYRNIISDSKDQKHTKIINAVNSFILTYCNRTFIDYYTVDKVEISNGTYNEYFPKEIPIVSVTSVEVSTDGGQNYTVLSEYTQFNTDYELDRIVSVNDQFVSTSFPINSLKITYKGGFEQYPEDIVQAAVSLVEYFDEENYTLRKSLAGASQDNVIIPDKTAVLPPHIRRVLEMYRLMTL